MSESGGRRMWPYLPVGTALAELHVRLCVMRDVRHRRDVGGLLFEI
jgi:hypothetical protein